MPGSNRCRVVEQHLDVSERPGSIGWGSRCLRCDGLSTPNATRCGARRGARPRAGDGLPAAVHCGAQPHRLRQHRVSAQRWRVEHTAAIVVALVAAVPGRSGDEERSRRRRTSSVSTTISDYPRRFDQRWRRGTADRCVVSEIARPTGALAFSPDERRRNGRHAANGDRHIVRHPVTIDPTSGWLLNGSRLRGRGRRSAG